MMAVTSVQTQNLADALSDFFATLPNAEQILSYKIPTEIDERAQELMDKNGEGTLTEQERQEFRDMLTMEYFLSMVKLKIEIALTAAT